MPDFVNKLNLAHQTMTTHEEGGSPTMSIFRRIPSVRERARRGSLGQVSGGAAIHDAIAKGKIHLAKFILDAVESQSVVNSRDVHGKTPLFRAVKLEDSDTRMKALNLLIRRGANVNQRDNMGRTALSYAAELHSNDAIKILVKNNVDPNIEDNNGNTPLLYCTFVDNAVGISILTKSFRRLGLDVDRLNSEGMSALMVAGKNGFVECVRLLANEGKASLQQRDKVRNMTAVEWAREGGCTTPEIEAFLPKINRLQAKNSDTSPSKLCTDLQRHLQKHESLDSNCSSTDGCSPRGTSRDSSTEELSHRRDSSSVTVAFPTPPTCRKNVKASSVDILSHRFHALHPIKNLSDHPNMKHLTDMKRSSLPDASDPHSFQYHLDRTPIILNQNPSKMDSTSRHVGAFSKRTKPSTNPRRPLSALNRQATNRQSKSFDGVSYESNSAEELRPISQVGKSMSMNHLANPITKTLLDLSFLSHSTEVLSPRSDCGSTEQRVNGETAVVNVDVDTRRSPPRTPDNALKANIGGQSELKSRFPPLSPRHERKEP